MTAGAKRAEATLRAMAMVKIEKKTPYAAALACGIWPSTVYNALRTDAGRRRKKKT
jgi:hypothetical protein